MNMPATPEQTSFLFGSNATYIAELYARYLEDPKSVDPSWEAFFADLHDDAKEVLTELRGASWAPNTATIIGNGATEVPAAPAKGKPNGQAAAKGNGAAVATAPAGISIEQLQIGRASCRERV